MQKISLLYLLLLYCCFSCQKAEKDYFDTFQSSLVVDLTDFKNFGGLRNHINAIEKELLHAVTEDYILIKFKVGDRYIYFPHIYFPREPTTCYGIHERNIKILNNSQEISQDHIERFILNRGQDTNLSLSPQKSMLFLDFPDHTPIGDVAQAMYQLRLIYTRLWQVEAINKYGKRLKHLDNNRLDAVKQEIPVYVCVRNQRGEGY